MSDSPSTNLEHLKEKHLKDCHLDHVAVAVKDLDESQKTYEAIGLSFADHRETVESQKVVTAFADLDQRARLELLCPSQESGPIHDFLQQKGPGIHHLCFRVSNVAQKSQELKQQGFRLIYETPQKGAGGHLVNFIHPKSTGGVLIEISEQAL